MMKPSLPLNEINKVIVTDTGPFNVLAAGNLLDLLLAPQKVSLVVIESVMNEIVSNNPKMASFFDVNADRIDVIRTSVCIDNADKFLRDEKINKRGLKLAIADFLMNNIDEVVGNANALFITDVTNTPSNFQHYEGNIHFITTDDYLQQLEAEGLFAGRLKIDDSYKKSIRQAAFRESVKDLSVEEAVKKASLFPPFERFDFKVIRSGEDNYKNQKKDD